MNDRLDKHERSKLHEAANNMYLRAEEQCTVERLLRKQQESEKEIRRLVLERLIQIIFFSAHH